MKPNEIFCDPCYGRQLEELFPDVKSAFVCHYNGIKNPLVIVTRDEANDRGIFKHYGCEPVYALSELITLAHKVPDDAYKVDDVRDEVFYGTVDGLARLIIEMMEVEA